MLQFSKFDAFVLFCTKFDRIHIKYNRAQKHLFIKLLHEMNLLHFQNQSMLVWDVPKSDTV